MERTRILLAEMPRMLSDILTNVLARERDMEVLRVLEKTDTLLRAVEESSADVVIVGLSDTELPRVCGDLVTANPHMKVLAVAGDGRRVFLHELRPHTVPLGEMSPAGLIDAIRAAVRSPRSPPSAAESTYRGPICP